MHDIKLEDGDILAKQKELARKNEEQLTNHQVKAINVMGAIGSGKTALVEAIVEKVDSDIEIGAVAGDVAGTDDYDRFKQAGIVAFNLNTDSECHLDAHLIEHSLENLPLNKLDVLFLENVGNLVCPADFPLGADLEIVVISVTEGDDMIRKHPKIFAQANLVAINKIDLSEAVNVDPEILKRDYHEINPQGQAILTAATKDKGVDQLIGALNLNEKEKPRG